MMKSMIVLLACVLAGMAPAVEPEIINLARTSLAEVTGSPTNGGRPIDNPYYGVLNLFDDGQHRLNNISYTYWVGDQADSWVELRFQAPVTVTAIGLEAPEEAKKVLDGISQRDYLLGDKRLPFPIQFTGTFSLTAYNQEDTVVAEKTVSFFEVLHLRGGWPPFAIHDVFVNFPQPLRDITRIRLMANARIDEWQVLGIPPAGVPYTIGLPRITRTSAGSGILAANQFQEWVKSLGKDAVSTTEETPTAFVTTFRKDGLPLFRVTVDKATGQATVEPLVEWSRKEQP